LGGKDYKFQTKEKEGVREGEEVSVIILFEPETAKEAKILLQQSSYLPLCPIPESLLRKER